MSYEAERASLRLFVSVTIQKLHALVAKMALIAARVDAKVEATTSSVVTRLSVVPARTYLVCSFVAVIGYALFMRTLHLWNSASYYVLSVDSHFFHWLALRIMNGDPPPLDAPEDAIEVLHSGLTYPLVYIGKVVSYASGLSSEAALDVAGKLLPPVIGLLSMLLLYKATKRIFNRRTALLAILAWAIMFYSVHVGAAGYLDRDGLTVLLMMTGVFVFYSAKDWHIRAGRLELGWALAGLTFILTEVLLYLEWNFMGPVLLLAIVLVYFAATILSKYLDHVEEKSIRVRLGMGLKNADWPILAFILLTNLLAVLFFYARLPSWAELITYLVRWRGQAGVAELAGLRFSDLAIAYGALIISVAFGLYVTWKSRARGCILFSSWFGILLILSLFSMRIIAFTVPAACVLAAVGFVFMWESIKQGGARLLKKAGMAVFVPLVFVSTYFPISAMGSNPLVAADAEWQDALAYVREETPVDSMVMSQWSWGYWILDLGERRPLVDNGYYGYPRSILRDVGIAYITAHPSEAADAMRKYGADYLLFCQMDVEYFGELISTWVDGDPVPFAEDSLVVLTMENKFSSGEGLRVVYRNTEVVILQLTDS